MILAAILLQGLTCPAGQMPVCATVTAQGQGAEVCTCADTYAGEEPAAFVFWVDIQGPPKASECAALGSRMREELTREAKAGREVTRATMPRECRKHSDARSYLVQGRRVPVSWVPRSQLIAAWARKK